MGYTHYWRHTKLNDEAWSEFLDDVIKIVNDPQIKELLADGRGEREPEVFDIAVRFNGKSPDDYETFTFLQSGTGFDFCKTAQRPYDMAVCLVLLRAKERFGDSIIVSSDGSWEEWSLGREAHNRLFGYDPPCPFNRQDEDEY